MLSPYRLVALAPDKFEYIGQGRSTWCRKAELSRELIQNTKEAPHGTYVLHRPGCSQMGVKCHVEYQVGYLAEM